MNLQENIVRIKEMMGLIVESDDNKVTCDECGWSWKLSEGGDDPYTCHKCGHTNQTNEDEVDEYSRTLKNARKQGSGLKFSKTAVKNAPLRFRPYNREMMDESDPKVGTGKKPEGSGRRLYTDENPNDTVSVKFRTKEDIIDTLNKDSFKSKSHKRQSQIINLIHQRVRAAYQNAKDPETKKRLKRGLDYIENEKEKSKEKTIKLQRQEQNEGEITERCWKGYTQKGMKTMFGKKYPNCVKIKK